MQEIDILLNTIEQTTPDFDVREFEAPDEDMILYLNKIDKEEALEQNRLNIKIKNKKFKSNLLIFEENKAQKSTLKNILINENHIIDFCSSKPLFNTFISEINYDLILFSAENYDQAKSFLNQYDGEANIIINAYHLSEYEQAQCLALGAIDVILKPNSELQIKYILDKFLEDKTEHEIITESLNDTKTIQSKKTFLDIDFVNLDSKTALRATAYKSNPLGFSCFTTEKFCPIRGQILIMKNLKKYEVRWIHMVQRGIYKFGLLLKPKL